MRDGAAQLKKRAMSVASLSPPTPHTALMSLLNVALSSVTAIEYTEDISKWTI